MDVFGPFSTLYEKIVPFGLKITKTKIFLLDPLVRADVSCPALIMKTEHVFLLVDRHTRHTGSISSSGLSSG